MLFSMRPIRAIASVSAVVAFLSFGSMASASAVSAGPDEVRVQMMIDGQLIDVSDRFQTGGTSSSAAESDTGPSDLLDWNQYFGCFSLNHRDDVYAEYGWWWDGKLQDVRLKCGESVWGYKHIRAQHESQWQDQLNRARTKGWNTGVGAWGSWDDLMNGAAGSVITWPDFVGGNAISKKTCAVAELYFVNSRTGAIVYSFLATAVWASDSDRLITAYPTPRADC